MALRKKASSTQSEAVPGFNWPANAEVVVWPGEAEPVTGPVDYVILKGMNDVANVKTTLLAARAALKDGGMVYIIGSSLPGRKHKLGKGQLARWFDWTGFAMKAFAPARTVAPGVTLPPGTKEGDVMCVGVKA